MASQSADQKAPPLSFLEFTRAYYKQDKNRLGIESADAMLSRDIQNYVRYLNDRRAFDDLSSFLWLCESIRETEYEFVPQSTFPENPAPPSCSLFRSQTAGIGPAYEYPQVYDTYGKFITGLASAETMAAYSAGRELVAEGDRRWLYGLGGHDRSVNAIEMHRLREEFRAVWQDASSIICPDIIDHPPRCASPKTKKNSLTSIYYMLIIGSSRPENKQPIYKDQLCLVTTRSSQSEEENEDDLPLSRYEWRQLARQAENDHVIKMTVEEFLDELREVETQIQADADMSDDEDENIHFPRFSLQRDDVYYGAACTDG
ncbi:hypothetical protein DL98DRAFT_591609 [Cadophora sp. DSE1049]|nr:hypothetical protein DL98DRAFT_591609 [Cadophora sp. DSE1049]